MNKLHIIFTDYLTTHFNYNPTNDIETSELAQTYDRLSTEYFEYVPHKEFKQCAYLNLNYKMLLPEIEFEGEVTSFLNGLFEYEFIRVGYADKMGWSEAIKEMLFNISSSEALELKDRGVNISEILYLVFFHLEIFPSVYSILNYDHIDGCYGYEPSGAVLKDPFYEYPELDLVYSLKEKFGFSNNKIVAVLDEDFDDYATYSVGDTNSDMRDEYNMYYQDFLKPYILRDQKDRVVSNQISLLNSYIVYLDSVELELCILGLALTNTNCTSKMENKISLKKHSCINNLKKEIPSVYLNNNEYQMVELTYPKTRAAISKKIDQLTNKKGR